MGEYRQRNVKPEQKQRRKKVRVNRQGMQVGFDLVSCHPQEV